MHTRVAIIYNEPVPSRYDTAGEEKAVKGVLDAVNAVHHSLVELNYEVTCLPLAPPMEQVIKTLSSQDVDLVFNLFEGFPGEPQTEAVVPDILSEMGIPFTGCSALFLRTALDKVKVKKMLIATGILTPDFQLLSPQKMNIFRLKFPCIVKPVKEDASHGITPESVVNSFTSLEKRIKMISDLYGEQALVENFIDGREFNVTMLGNSRYTILPVSEIVFSLPPMMPAILTFHAKWEPDSIYYKGTKVVCPATITHREEVNIRETAMAVFQLLGGSGYARLDIRMDKKGHLFVIEVNPNPDISPEAGTVRQAAAAGMNYTQFVEEIIKLTRYKKRDDNKNKTRIKQRQSDINSTTKKHARI